MNTLRLLQLKISLKLTADTKLPGFIGNTIRGALGQALFDNNNQFWDKLHCADCCYDLREHNMRTYGCCNDCAYGNVFKLAENISVPNPYTISVPYPVKEYHKKGEVLTFTITLFGNAARFATQIEKAAKNMCKGKLVNYEYIGSESVYDRVWDDCMAESIPHTESVKITFLTPTEIISSKVPLREIEFGAFIDSLFGRTCDIIDAYTDGKFILPYSLVARKPFVTAEYNLRRIDFKTNGQQINGVVGSVTYIGDVTRFMPYIDLGSQIHIGKKATRACGEYSFEI
ncbi:MAG: CRISPR system precrRNA processing endoribonuclease RAMP protein Cas6 [Clostridiales bacterium]|jgi:hypothetical protein|nr:CRISPR system precrRNA processing endoribonuclease RAMP protein Cas6 [Clostridiales bacterium]